MSGLFEHLAAQDDTHRVAQRKATAVANKRVKDRYGAFMANATDEDRAARLALVEDGITEVVAEVTEEYGGDAKIIEAAIRRTLGGGADHLKEYQFGKGDKDDDSDDKSDDSDSDDDSDDDSDSKPDFGSDDKSDDSDDDDDDDDSKESSTGDRSPLGKTARRPKMCPYHSEVVDVSLGSGDPQAGYNALASHAWGDKHCKGDFQGSCNFRPQMVTQKFWDDKKDEYAERARQRVEQDIAPDLGIETEPIMTQEPLEVKPGEGITDIDGEMAEAPSAVGGAELEPAMARSAADAPKGAGGAVTRESLPKANESGQGGPSPKIDKGNSGDENGWTLDDIDTEEENSPHPTISQDPTDTAKYDKDDFTAQTEAVTTDQDLPTADESGQSTERNVEQPATDTWSGTEGLANPVSSVDPDKNPLREIAESQFDGFVPSTQVQAAIQQHEQQS